MNMAVSYSLPGMLTLPPDWGVEPKLVVTGAPPRIAAFELEGESSTPGEIRPARKGWDAGAFESTKLLNGVEDVKVSALAADPTR